MWFGEDQRTNNIKSTFLKEVAFHLQVLLTPTHSIVNTIGPMYLIKESTNMQLQVQHQFVDVLQVLLCKCDL